MGKWKSLIVACLGLGVATGVGFYIYRSISSEENSYTMKVMAKELGRNSFSIMCRGNRTFQTKVCKLVLI